MPRKRSGMDLSHSWWPQINCVHSLSIVKHTAPNLVAQNNTCPLPVSRIWRVRISRSGSGRDWAGCQVSDGAAISPAGSAGAGSICFPLRCVVAGRPRFLMGWRTEGLCFFLWVSTGSPNMAVSFIRRELWEEPGREGGIKRERKRGGKWIFFNLISVVILQYFHYIISTKLSH